MEVICLEDEAFYALVAKVVDRLKSGQPKEQPRWIGPDETMSLLHIKSDTTLQKLRDEGKIRFTQPQKKIILYDRDSVMKYLESHARNTF